MSLAVQLLEDFRARRGKDKNLADLEQWMVSKLRILSRRSKRQPTERTQTEVKVFRAGIQEVRSMRFDVLARRAAMPKMGF